MAQHFSSDMVATTAENEKSTVFVRLHAHPPLSPDSMHSELGVFYVIFAFCDMIEVKIWINTDNFKLNSTHMPLLYRQVRVGVDY